MAKVLSLFLPFTQRLWRFRSPTQRDYDKLALLVAGYLQELESALREGRLGPHMRRLVIKPLPPDVLERLQKLKAEGEKVI